MMVVVARVEFGAHPAKIEIENASAVLEVNCTILWSGIRRRQEASRLNLGELPP